ncbi:MAG: restriction endonuclease subunit S [Candidatus Ancillula sp.]|jgi:type I restriction enzyme S subunit|nr:restriction endonuclease subunit S [Candidatus Ancillula sp.]
MPEERIIPQGWREVKLGEVGDFFKGAGIAKDDAQSGDLPAVRYGELYTDYDFKIATSTRSNISVQVASEATEIHRGDLLFAGSGEKVEEIGKSAVFMLDKGYAGGDIVGFRPTDSDGLFLSYYLNTAGRKQINRLGQGQSIVHIHKPDLDGIKFLAPPKKEQQAIVSVLEVWDEAVEKLKRKIALKEKLKKGLMQQLLTVPKGVDAPALRTIDPETSKPFASEWKNVKLGEVSKTLVPPRKLQNKEFQKTGKFSIVDQSPDIICGYTNNERAILPSGEYLIFGDHSEVIKFVDFQFAQGADGIKIITPLKCHSELDSESMDSASKHKMTNMCDTRFVYYSFSKHYKVLGNYKRHWSGARETKISLPTLPEQQAISSILSTADRELDALRSILSNLKEQKKFLLSNLVTGQIRLPEFEILNQAQDDRSEIRDDGSLHEDDNSVILKKRRQNDE